MVALKLYLTLFFICYSQIFPVPKQNIDLLVVNANIYTVDDAFSKATAFAVDKGKFVAVGTSTRLEEKYSAEIRIDAKGKTIVPGLIDAHCHFYGLGLSQQTVNLVGTDSFDEILDRITTFQKEHQVAFIQGSGWDQNDWETKEFPTKEGLDKLFPTVPVVLERIDGHAMLVNQVALDLAGIDPDTKVDGGEIVVKDGKLTGVLVDNPMGLIYKIIPPPTLSTEIQALKEAEKICLGFGLTTVDDAGLDRSTIELIDSLQQSGDLSIRVYAMASSSPSNLDYYLKKGVVKTDKLHIGSIKVYADGALGSRGAALKKPYSDKPGHYGAMVTPVVTINALAERIANSDYQMNTHAIGDSANAVVLRAYKNALKGQTNRRWRIEHAQVIDPADFEYFKTGIIPSVQPTHATSDMYWAEDRLGPARIKGAYALNTLLQQAGLVALGTDFPVEQVNPFLTFYAATSRRDLKGYPKDGFQMQDALTRKEALKGMTIWAAYSNFEEIEKGSIEVGKMADFTVLSGDIMQIPSDQIHQLKAEKTFIGGMQVGSSVVNRKQ